VCVSVCVGGVESITFRTLDSIVWCGNMRAADPRSFTSFRCHKLLSIAYVPCASNTKQVYFNFLYLQHTSHDILADVFLETLSMSDSPYLPNFNWRYYPKRRL